MIPVRNPLTVVAIFAGSAEVAGAAVLPHVSEATQGIYVWFLMGFPILVLLLFFSTLNWNHKVFYAPSDFKDEGNFFKAFQPMSVKDRVEKFKEQAKEAAEAPREIAPAAVGALGPDTLQLFRQDPRTLYSLVEQFVVGELEKEFHTVARRDLSLKSRYGTYVFDAILESGGRKIIAEIKLATRTSQITRMRDTLGKIQGALFSLPLEYKKTLTVFLAIAYDLSESDKSELERELRSMILDFDFPIELRFYPITNLAKSLEK